MNTIIINFSSPQSNIILRKTLFLPLDRKSARFYPPPTAFDKRKPTTQAATTAYKIITTPLPILYRASSKDVRELYVPAGCVYLPDSSPPEAAGETTELIKSSEEEKRNRRKRKREKGTINKIRRERKKVFDEAVAAKQSAKLIVAFSLS